MRTDLPQDVIARYQAEGFVHVPGFLSADEVSELKSAVLDAVGSMGNRRVSDSSIDFKDADDFYAKVFTQRLNLWKINPTVKRYMLSPQLGQLLCQLEGVRGMRVWHDQALIKEPFGNGTAWHLDNPYWSFNSRNSISIWIALEDATPYNGCMCFIPGSHKLARYDNVGIGVNMGDQFKLYPEMAKIDPVAVPMKAGDCSFHNGRRCGPGTTNAAAMAKCRACARRDVLSMHGSQCILKAEWHLLGVCGRSGRRAPDGSTSDGVQSSAIFITSCSLPRGHTTSSRPRTRPTSRPTRRSPPRPGSPGSGRSWPCASPHPRTRAARSSSRRRPRPSPPSSPASPVARRPSATR